MSEAMTNMISEERKKLILEWDPDFTCVTAEEAKRIEAAEKSGFVNANDIDWDDLDSIV